ncbi:hypothetical protein BO83DRAFT_51781 [Aspergillus eucalypticola CBS 122712]|uniref:Uncharacterized protein n=1 Tax=Aspergillus eucalypticola (strain CBS 122712 / IBT 29274) TaxID=1448314 RepID=A0A317VBD8_ASPEC|nr:uncharacterized protein BO83DRAFT_51781 [Aspergillus eucalypticola CBS 122712]PWY71345.1 hypothetical protein BO83DRAFT_51781 [Aspergillus eucalypticola CBS 122712]
MAHSLASQLSAWSSSSPRLPFWAKLRTASRMTHRLLSQVCLRLLSLLLKLDQMAVQQEPVILARVRSDSQISSNLVDKMTIASGRPTTTSFQQVSGLGSQMETKDLRLTGRSPSRL